MQHEKLLTASIYDIAEVARLAQLSVSRTRRWLRGYSYEYKALQRHKAPVVHREETALASFLDLIELRFAKTFIDHGFSPQRVRAAYDEAASVTGQDHPFARKRFFEMGRRLFLELKHHAQDTPNLLELFTGGQWAIERVVRHYATQVEFDQHTSAAVRWWPLGRRTPVIVDPRFSAGAPTIENKGIRTSNLYSLYLGERKNTRAVAEWMGVSVSEVEAAIRFEQKWSLPLAA